MKAQTMRQLRQIHNYVGVFFAPMIILFALSGALQTFRLQEVGGYGGTPPDWIVWMAAVHKNQELDSDKDKPANARPDRHADEPAKKPPSLAKRVRRNPAKFALQLFTVLLSIGLLISSILGVTIALNNRAKRGRTFGLLAAGAILPLFLLYV